MKHYNLIKITDFAYLLGISASDLTNICSQLQIYKITDKDSGSEYISKKAQKIIIRVFNKAEKMDISPFFLLETMHFKPRLFSD